MFENGETWSGDSRKERLARYIVQYYRFNPTRQIRIYRFLSQKLVMLNVIPLESHRVRYTDRQIGHNGQAFVCFDTLEGEIVRYFVDCKEDVLVCGPADRVRRQEERWGEWVGVSEVIREGKL